MKKLIVVLAMVLGLLVSGVTFARDDEHLQDKTNWTVFKTEKGCAYSYEYGTDGGMLAVSYKFKDAIGYQYFYIKVEIIDQAVRDKWQEAYEKELKGAKFGYMIWWFKMDCKNPANPMVEFEETYVYSAKNEFVVCQSLKGTPNAKPFELYDSRYKTIPFNQVWMTGAENSVKGHFQQVRDKQEAVQAKLKKYGVVKSMLVTEFRANPYEFEGQVIGVYPLVFERMMSRTSASFSSPFDDVGGQVIVTNIPQGTHFTAAPMGFHKAYAPALIIIGRPKGNVSGTNAFGAVVDAPNLSYIASWSINIWGN